MQLFCLNITVILINVNFPYTEFYFESNMAKASN